MLTDRCSAARLIIVAFMMGLLWTQARAASEDYRLGAGDLLKIVVFDHDELNLDARVSQTGNITFALVGQVPVGGLSTREAELLLSKRLADGGFVSQPQVSILVSDYESQKVSVMGQVTKAGQYPLDSSKSVLDALALAGGPLTDTAGDDATLIGERAATRGRLAMEDGAERAGEPNSIRHWRFRTRISATLCDPRDRPRAKIR